ncbi:hypothetical protein P691DRAFT_111901 [Macrolepiota fuliginosa MF-IS2]|uniref:Uncharacterized protein n=1 Tax=Macrolepiota fuliginosa MF-IS2 TaxID=1400762 RepID=A0A9P5XDY4_9AGAR|nr:hypothetical protein P691DRAFT_111901 [Macrolepiota fuliginosa MF-IS2]
MIVDADSRRQIDELTEETGLVVGLYDPSSKSFAPPLPLLNKYSPYAGLRATDTAPIMVTGSMGYFGFKQT